MLRIIGATVWERNDCLGINIPNPTKWMCYIMVFCWPTYSLELATLLDDHILPEHPGGGRLLHCLQESNRLLGRTAAAWLTADMELLVKYLNGLRWQIQMFRLSPHLNSRNLKQFIKSLNNLSKDESIAIFLVLQIAHPDHELGANLAPGRDDLVRELPEGNGEEKGV